jgi:23S rRNA (cytidine1920-2'-O)/16S rRNA (cytidine1409-2'-O)-methyltransferase
VRETRKARLDVLLVERGLVSSRERARALILAGRVSVDAAVVSKAGTLVTRSADIRLAEPDHPFVGRGGVKLAYALERFGLAVAGRTALDIGASTGGFTDALLQGGASRVVALDVGHGQIDWTLRNDPRVVVLERVNARHLRPDQLPADVGQVDIVTIDVSFISLVHILPVVPPLLAPAADVLVLVKPQFEAGRREVGRGGVVRDPDVQARVVGEISTAADALALATIGSCESPIQGADGNREFFLHVRMRSRHVS